jgi:hypothetical protein
MSTTMKTTIRKGDTIRIKPEWQDPGDDNFIWVALEDEDGGRVRITPTNTGLPIPPNQVVDTNMLELAS